MTNNTSTYNETIRGNLPVGISYDSTRFRYFVNGKPFHNYTNAYWYWRYLIKFSWTGGGDYSANGYNPTLVADMANDTFWNGGETPLDEMSFDDIFTTSRLGLGTMTDSDGLLKWAPHNLLTYSNDFSDAAWTKTRASITADAVSYGAISLDKLVESTDGSSHFIQQAFSTVSGVEYTFKVVAKRAERSIRLQMPLAAFGSNIILEVDLTDLSIGAATTAVDYGVVDKGDGFYEVSCTATATASTSALHLILLYNDATGSAFYTGDGASGLYVGAAHFYRSDLGGMVNNPDRGDSYVPTTSAAVYLPRRHNHKYDGSAWVDAGTLIETEARTQLLHTTNTLVTQSHTVTAVPHTLHFTGTGTVTLSGASTAGPLVGTGTGEENRVSLTFTPTAASLTLTVTGTVTDAQLEVGSTPSSYIPNLAGSGTVNRAADSPLTVAGADVPWPTPTVIGGELVTNGTFDTDSDWTKGASWTISGGVASASDGSASSLIQTLSTTTGKLYAVTFTISNGSGSWFLGVRLGDATNQYAFTAEGTKTVYLVDKGDHILRFADGVSGSFGIDNISVKEINPLAVCIQMEGDMTYADTGATEAVFYRWYIDNSNRIVADLRASGAATGKPYFFQVASGTLDDADSSIDAYSPGINVPFNIASRHGSTFINGAVDGTALTEDTTPVALPDLSSTDLEIAYDFMGNVKQVRIWAVDIGDTGLEASTS